MTRKEKREAAAEELRKIKLEWYERLKADHDKTKDLKKSVKNLEAEIARQINREPQKKTQYLQALRSLIKNFSEAVRAAKKDMENEENKTE